MRISNLSIINFGNYLLFSEWLLRKWYVWLYLSKCKHINFSRRCDFVNTYTINNYKLELVNTIVDLGILLDTKLTIVHNISMLVNKARGVWAFIKRWSREFNDRYVTKYLYTDFGIWLSNLESVLCRTNWPHWVRRSKAIFNILLKICISWLFNSFRLALLNLPSLKSRRIMLNIFLIVNFIKLSLI